MDNNKKQIFEETTKKQLKYSKKVFLLIYGLIGIIFLILALVLYLLGVKDEDGFTLSIIFAPMGAFWLLLGIILYFALPKKYNYDRFEKRVKRWGFINYFEISATVEAQKEKIKELEERISSLERNEK
jgi:tellurite resistance protein TehA-like permease